MNDLKIQQKTYRALNEKKAFRSHYESSPMKLKWGENLAETVSFPVLPTPSLSLFLSSPGFIPPPQIISCKQARHTSNLPSSPLFEGCELCAYIWEAAAGQEFSIPTN